MSARLEENLDSPIDRELAGFRGLLQSLVPRATAFHFAQNDGGLIWSSEPALADGGSLAAPVDAELGRVAMAAEPKGPRFFIPLQAAEARLVIDFPVDVTPMPTVDTVARLLAPLVAVLSNTLTSARRVSTLTQSVSGLEKRLKLIYQLDNTANSESRGQGGLAQLVSAAARSLRIGYTVLLLPDKRIRFSLTHPTWKPVNRKLLDKTAVNKLLSAVSARSEPILLDVSTPPAGLSVDIGPYQIIACPIREGQSRVCGVLALFGQVEQHKFTAADLNFTTHIARRAERIVELNYDPMTSLMNRSGFDAHLQTAYEELKDASDEHALMFFDMDQLQLFNDTFDHKAGDEVLIRFASELKQLLPADGVASRISGDDFAVLLPHTSVEDAVKVAEKMRLAAHKMSYLKGDKSHQITVSVGVAPLRRTDEGHAGALISPKVACRAAKDHGRDRVEVYDQDNHSIVRRIDDMHIVGQVHSALNAGDFQLLAQPIVPLAGTDAPYYEVLVRMNDASGVALKPAEFFSAAERYQLMPQLDRFVIETSISRLAEHASVLDRLQPRFAINLSGQSLQDDALLEFVTEVITRTGVSPSALCFEITETAAVANMSSARRFIATLRRQGASFSLDDFGSGLSSFAYLKSFAVDTLKIDGGFVHDITTNKVSESMVAAITQVAGVMGLKTIAEYVESEDIREKVRAIGVDFAQGYVVGEPRPLDTILAELGTDKSDAEQASA